MRLTAIYNEAMPEAAHAERSRSSRRKRIRLGMFLLLFLTGGAIVNVAVAWGCAYAIPIPQIAGSIDEGRARPSEFCTWWAGSTSRPGLIRVISDWRIETGILGESFGNNPSEVVPHWADQLRPIADGPNVSELSFADARGWPTVSMFSIFAMEHWGRGLQGQTASNKVISGLSLPPNGDPRGQGHFRVRILPIRPIWPGFAINTIFYAAILALLFYGPGKVRRMVRIHRSQCPACGHIIAAGTCANGLCSECGAKLPHLLRRSAGM